jgi:RNA 2',3'-cyclic 3'-phosphodiesterase
VKLFVAGVLPANVLDAIVQALPQPSANVRVSMRDQLHLTLHYIGETDVELVGTALRSVRSSLVVMTVQGNGRFDGHKGSTVVWARVQPSNQLARLHADDGSI